MGKYQDALITAGTKVDAAKLIGIPVNTFKDRLKKELSGATPEVKTKPSANKLRLYGISEVSVPKSDKPIRVLYFTDAHNRPDLPLDRFVLLKRMIDDTGPDVVVDGGDFGCYASVCFHDRDDTIKGKLKPSIALDLECEAKARKILDGASHKCILESLMGNHEVRMWRYEDANPASHGLATNLYMDILKSFGWNRHEYGAYLDIGGVDFTHIPFNRMKEMGGENVCATVAKLSSKSKVFGHTHALGVFVHQKTDNKSGVMAFNGGSFMPDGYVGDYAKKTSTSYWYGAHILTIKNGVVLSIKSYHMQELQALYGD